MFAFYTDISYLQLPQRHCGDQEFLNFKKLESQKLIELEINQRWNCQMQAPQQQKQYQQQQTQQEQQQEQQQPQQEQHIYNHIDLINGLKSVYKE